MSRVAGRGCAADRSTVTESSAVAVGRGRLAGLQASLQPILHGHEAPVLKIIGIKVDPAMIIEIYLIKLLPISVEL